MIKKKLILFGIVLLVLPFFSASQISSSNYGVDAVLSSGGQNVSSSNYEMNTILGTTTGNASSTSYKQFIGLFYTSVEAPSPVIPITPSPSGGGVSTITTGFTLNRDLIKVLVKQGESEREIVIIKNLGSTSLDIVFELDELRKFMAVSEESFTLIGKSSKSIFIDIFAKEAEPPEAYTGRIIVKDNTGATKIINIIIEIKERKPVFDVRVDLLSKEVSAGRKIKARFNVVNFGDLENIDILLYYSIRDFEGNLLSFKEESVLIKDKLNIVRELRIPKDTLVGDYVFYLKASYGNITASATDSFKVTEKRLISTFLILFIILSIVIILLILMVFKILNHYKKGHFGVKDKTKKEKMKKGIFSKRKVKKEEVGERRIEPIKKIEREKRLPRKMNKTDSAKKLHRTKKEMYNKLLDSTIKMKKKSLKEK